MSGYPFKWEGDSLFLTCDTDANPGATYSWYKEEEDGGRDLLKRTMKLYIPAMQSSDFGSYYCIAENQLGSKRSNSTLIKVASE